MKSDLVANGHSKESGLPAIFNQTILFQKLLDASLDVICAIDQQGRFLTLNAAAKRVWGYEPHELIGTCHVDLVCEALKASTLKATLDIMSHSDIAHFESQYICKDGSVTSLLWSAHWDREDRILYCVAKDASEKNNEAYTAKKLERKLYRAYKLTGIAWWELDISSGIYTCSEEFFTIFGLPVRKTNQVSLEELLSYVHPADVPRLKNDQTNFCEDSFFVYEHRVVKPDGKIIYVIHYAEIVRDAQGRPIALHGTTKDITQRKLYQLQLEASEKRLADILESIGDGFFAVNRDWVITYWNCKAEQILGKKREDIIGKVLWDEYSDAIQLKFYTEYHRAVQDKVNIHFEEYLPSLDVWFEVSVYPFEEGISVFFKNINEKRKREKALRESNERFELVSKATSDAIYDYNVLTGTCFFSPSFTTLFGHTQIKDSLEINWTKHLPEEDRELVLQGLYAALADRNKSQWQEEYRFVKADGKIAHVLERGFIIRNEEGQAVRMVGSMQDVTQLKEAADDLKRLSLVAKETVNVVIITDREDKITWVNKAFTDITEYSFEEAIGKNPGALLQGPETNEATKAYLHRCRLQKTFFHCELINYTKSGRKYWMEIKGQPILNGKGEVEQFFAIQTDITKRKEAEETIRLSEAKYKLLFHKSSQAKWICKSDIFEIVEVNDAAVALYGYSREEFLQLTLPDLKLQEETKEFKDSIQAHLKGNRDTYTNVIRHVKKSGEIFYVELVCNCIELPSGLHFIVTTNDMTEKLALELMVIEEKVTAQKEMSRAIINAQEKERTEIGKELHDNVNQLIATAKLYIENIKHFPEQSSLFIEKSRDILNKTINEVRFLSSQLVSPTITDIGLKETLLELMEYYTELKIFRIDFTCDIEETTLEEGVKFTLYRIIQEQLNNAVKYAQATEIHLGIRQSKNSLTLHYKDNGVGFDMTIKKNGIGLKNIQNRVAIYKGSIQLESALGKGCTMVIHFPVH